jgi:hypothetical protein
MTSGRFSGPPYDESARACRAFAGSKAYASVSMEPGNPGGLMLSVEVQELYYTSRQ